jgi:hypothetical protein
MPSKTPKVGTLDDPVWDEHPEEPRSSNRRLHLWTVGFIFGLLSTLLAVGLAFRVSSSDHAGGDPGGRILKELGPASGAVPSGSTDVVTHDNDAIWSGACPDNASGRAGWSEVSISTTFTTSLSKEQVTDAVNAALVHQGWLRHDVSFGPGQGVNAHWTKRLASGALGEAAVYPVPAGSTNWLLSVASKPPGFALPGC